MRKTVYDEGIQAINGVIMGIGKEFSAYMNKYMPYLLYALKNQEDSTLCKVAVGGIGDLSRALEERISPYLEQIVPVLMDILRNPETDRNLKPIIITVLGDLAFATSKLFMLYMHDLLEMLKGAAALSLQSQQDVLKQRNNIGRSRTAGIHESPERKLD